MEDSDATVANDCSTSPEEMRADFHILLARLDKESGRAAERYEQLRQKLISYFRWNSCFPAEELTDETIDRVARKVRCNDVLDVYSFAYGVAKNVRLEYLRRDSKTISFDNLPEAGTRLSGACTPHDIVQGKLLLERQLRCLGDCMRRLPPGDRSALVTYFGANLEHAAQRQSLANALGVSIGTLRVRMNRLRATLEACIVRCTARSAKPIGTPKGQQ